MSVLKDLRAWRNDEFDGNVGDMLNEVERILEKAEKNSCEGCKYSGKMKSFYSQELLKQIGVRNEDR